MIAETENVEPSVACGSLSAEASQTWNVNAGASVTAKWRHGLSGEFFPVDHWGESDPELFSSPWFT